MAELQAQRQVIGHEAPHGEIQLKHTVGNRAAGRAIPTVSVARPAEIVGFGMVAHSPGEQAVPLPMIDWAWAAWVDVATQARRKTFFTDEKNEE